MRSVVAMIAAFVMTASAATAGTDPVTVSVLPPERAVSPGEEISFEVTFGIARGYHIYPHAEALTERVRNLVTPTRVSLINGGTFFSGGELVWLQEPEYLTVDLGEGPLKVPVFAGTPRAIFKTRVRGGAVPPKRPVELRIAYQACTETVCTAPTHTDVKFDLAVQGESVGDPAANRSFHLTLFGYDLTIDPDTLVGMLLWLALAALAGLLLNLMPCVLPMISIKIEILKNYAGSPRRAAWLGFMMFLGIVTFWSVLGALVAYLSGFGGISALFQTPAFTIGAGIFMGAMGILMLREYVLELPGFLNRFNPLAKSASGAFFFGVMQALFATACAAPFMGTAVAWAIAQGRPELALTTFVAAGVGMGLPLWMLTIIPQLRRILPPGEWGVVTKKAMGWLMLGAACYFVGAGHNGLLARYPFLNKVEHIWAALTCFAVGLGLVMFYALTLRMRWWARGPIVVAAALGLAGCGLVARNVFETERQAHEQNSVWQPYSPAAFEKARAAGKVVVVDFTADWCINCKVLEQTVLRTEAVQAFVRENDVVCFTADVTIASGPAYDFMRRLGKGDPPLLVVYGPGVGNSPILSNAYGISDFEEYVRRAKGPASSR